MKIYRDVQQMAFLHKIEKGQAKNYLVLKELANLGMEEVLNHYYDVFGTQSIEG